MLAAGPPQAAQIEVEPPPSAPRPEEVELDWAEYFRGFCRIHGDPLTLDGRLVFPDGWSYSCTSHAGPEYPPPANPLDRALLQRTYWTLRKRINQVEAEELRKDVEALARLDAAKSAPLVQFYPFQGEDGKWKMGSRVVDLNAFLGRLRWLEDDVRLAEDELKKLNVRLKEAGYVRD